MRGNGRVFLRGETWWIAYCLRGKEYRQSAKTQDPKVAEKFLRGRLKEVHADEIGARPFTTPKATRLTLHDLLEALRADYVLRGKNSVQNLSHLKRADQDFGEYRAMALTAEEIDSYVEKRLAAMPAQVSTV
jgi:hypothetical protein